MDRNEREDNNKAAEEPKLSINGAVLNIIKCAIGAGSFSLPRSFMEGGVYLSFLLTFCLGLLSALTVLLLIESSTIVGELELYRKSIKNEIKSSNINNQYDSRNNNDKFTYLPLEHSVEDSTIEGNQQHIITTNENENTNEKLLSLNYAEMGAYAFSETNVQFNNSKFNITYWIIFFSILSTSLGVCAAYLDFISETLPQILCGITNNTESNTCFLTQANTPLLLTPLVLCLTGLKTEYLTYTSIIGDVAVFVGCMVVILYGYIYYQKDIALSHNFVEWKTLPRYFAGNTFLLAIHVVILPLMAKMESTTNNENMKKAIAYSFSLITLFNAMFGTLGFLFYASSECANNEVLYYGPCANVLSNMEGGKILNSVKLLVCFDLLLTVPLILAASRVIIEKIVFESDCILWLYKRYKRCMEDKLANNDVTSSVLDSSISYPIHHLQQPTIYVTPFPLPSSSPSSSPFLTGVDISDINSLPSISFSKDDNYSQPLNTSLIDNRNASTSHFHLHINISAENKRNDRDNTNGLISELIPEETCDNNGRNNYSYNSNNRIDIRRGNDLGETKIKEILDNNICNNNSGSNPDTFTFAVKCFIRLVLVSVVVILAVNIPQFGDMINIVGGFVLPLTCFILPPIMYIRLYTQLNRLPIRTVNIDNTDNIDISSHKTTIFGVMDSIDNENTIQVDSSRILQSTPQKREKLKISTVFGLICIVIFGLVSMIANMILSASSS